MTHALRPGAGRPVIRTEAAVRRRVPGNADQAGRSRCAVPFCQPGDADGRPRRRDLGAGTHAADQSRPAAGAARIGRALLPPGIVRSRADLSGYGAEIAVTARGCAGQGTGISCGNRVQVEAVKPGRRSLLRLALPDQRQSRPRGLERAVVRTAGQPQPGRPGDGRLGRREFGNGPASLRLRQSGQGGARNPVHRLCQPPVPGNGRQRLPARPDERAAFPGLQRHLRGLSR